MFTPIDHRIGHRLFETAVGKKLLRAVHLRAYSFLLAFFEPDEKAAVREDFSQHFLNHHPHAALLRASRKSVELVCDGLSAWENWEGCRENVISNERPDPAHRCEKSGESCGTAPPARGWWPQPLAAQRAVTLKDKHKFKAEMDDEARKAMFRQMAEKVA
jgi:hypothetical protein